MPPCFAKACAVCTGGRGAGGSRSKQVLEGGLKANARSGAQSGSQPKLGARAPTASQWFPGTLSEAELWGLLPYRVTGNLYITVLFRHFLRGSSSQG